MNKKMMIGLVIVAAVLLVSIVVLLLLAQRSTPTEPIATTNTTNNASTPPANTTTDITPTNTTNSTTTNPAVTVDSKTSLYQTARFFTERYGSYSTDGEHENIDSLRPFMTAAMQTTADELIATQANTNSYYGVTTQAAHVNIVDYTPGATGATVEVVTRRSETTNGTTTQYTQTARLQFKKINRAWKVDTFKWQKL